jgi:hypothetical protein
LFLLPVWLAKDLGFQDVLFLVDNFDSMNIPLNMRTEFEYREVFRMEKFKTVLSGTQFVPSYHDSHEFRNCLVAFKEGMFDFELTLEYYSVLDIECEPDYAN